LEVKQPSFSPNPYDNGTPGSVNFLGGGGGCSFPATSLFGGGGGGGFGNTAPDAKYDRNEIPAGAQENSSFLPPICNLFLFGGAMKKEEEEEGLAPPSLPEEAEEEEEEDEVPLSRGAGEMLVAIPFLRGERRALIASAGAGQGSSLFLFCGLIKFSR